MRPKRILVVDDDPNMLLLIDFNLSARGHDVEKVTDGPTGLRRALEGGFDLVILDVMLPGLSGFRIAQSLREDPRGRDVPILLVTARSRTEDFERASLVAATDYITKPFDPIALVDQVDRILGVTPGTAP
jgi:DNA-binding response OmpR family regulator